MNNKSHQRRKRGIAASAFLAVLVVGDMPRAQDQPPPPSTTAIEEPAIPVPSLRPDRAQRLLYNQALPDEDLHSRLLRRMTIDASAEIKSYLDATIALEAGDSSLAQTLERKKDKNWDIFKQNLEINLSQGDASRISARDQAALQTFTTLLRDAERIENASEKVFIDYLNVIKKSSALPNPDLSINRDQALFILGLSDDKHILTLPGPEEIATLSAKTSETMQALEDIHIRKALPLPPALPDTPTVENVLKEIEQSGNRYTVAQAIDRARHARENIYPDRIEPMMKKIFDTCAQADYTKDQVPAEAKNLWNNLQRLREISPLIGGALYDFSAKANIFHCHDDLGEDTNGRWMDRDGISRVHHKLFQNHDKTLSVQAHEIMHGLQKRQGGRDYISGWSIHESQIYTMTHEAAAKAIEYLVALEAKHNGTPDLWNILPNNSVKQATLAAFTDAYDMQKLPLATALEKAGYAAWQEQFKQQGWLDAYNKRILHNHLLVFTNTAVRPTNKESYSIDTARRAGMIREDLNFTREISALPAFSDRFGKNKQMQQAFEYVHLERMGRGYGRSDARYLIMLQKLESDANPFLGVDLKRVADELSKNPDRNALESMKCYAGTTLCLQNALPFNPTPYKINMRPVR